jgi:peptidoglycan/LPS O-acetylase OafA/YrhL
MIHFRRDGRATSSAANEQLPSLTSLRGVAAFWVVLYHYSIQCFPNLDASSYTHIIHKGYLAVDMFFMLSGFVMTHVYHEAFSESATEHYRRFIVARIARIYPLHILVLLLFVATAAGPFLITRPPLEALKDVPLQGAESVNALFANILMLQGLDASRLSWNYPAWSISVEFMAYLLFPFALPVIWRAPARVKVILGMVLFGCLAFLAFLTKGSFDQWDGPITLLRCLPEFIVGTLLYCAYRVRIGEYFLRHDVTAYLIVGVLVIFLHVDAPDLVITLLFSIFILAAVLNTGTFSKMANNQHLIWLGSISYSLYLIHGFIQYLADKILGDFGVENNLDLSIDNSLLLMTIMVATCLVAAHFSYSCVEIGCRQYLRRLLSPRERKAAKSGLRFPRALRAD